MDSTLEKLIDIATDVFGADPRNDDRKRESIWARRAIFSINVKGDTNKSRGEYFGKDHSTVIYHEKEHKTALIYDKEYRILYERFERRAMKLRGAHRKTNLLYVIPDNPELKEKISRYVELNVALYNRKNGLTA